MSARRGQFSSSSSSSSIMRRRSTMKKSMSDIINEQFADEKGQFDETDAWDDGGGDGPHIDDYHEDGGIGEEDCYNDNDNNRYLQQHETGPAAKRKKTERLQQEQQEEKKRTKLRRRGPLDASLSTGEYAATPVDVEAAMDGIFGALEMDEHEDDDDFGDIPMNGTAAINSDDNANNEDEDDYYNNNYYYYESEERSAAETLRGKKRKRTSGGGQPETEEEYIAWLKARQAKKQALRRSIGGDDEGNILEQLESLRNAQMELMAKETAEGDKDDPRAKERQRAQAAVRHYVMLYSQLLRVRLKLQPVVVRAVAFPQYYALPDFLKSDGGEIRSGVDEVVDSLNTLLSTFYSLASDGKESKQKQKSQEGQCTVSPNFKEMNACHRRMMKDVDECIGYWGAKLVQPNSVKLRTISQPLLHQIRAILESKARLRAKVQKNRSHVFILAHPEHHQATVSAEGKAARALHIAAGDNDDEIYDDAEFLREVVRRGGVARLQQEQQQILEEQHSLRATAVPSKRGFHRLTKGKSVNYEPRPKLVGFLMPVPYTYNEQHEVMVNSLFQ
ncbi:Apoptosis-antagonizing transcription factor [Trypanosoma melophagium]|uniref:Apoptosis-antagonizing transcription factor n=1 Tax=Trypanosoma melophagium TaxID=715481 RepID=UPI003519EF64|nr:Apoptosis-antagonizing transcription factor [Trypanosoma melophagium]